MLMYWDIKTGVGCQPGVDALTARARGVVPLYAPNKRRGGSEATRQER
jgi:hypothetical protein